MRRRVGIAVFVPALGAALAACGYGLVGQNTLLPEHVRVIAVIPFENRTERPEIEQRVTESVSRELSKRRRYRVVTSSEGADALLEGAVASFRTSPVQFNRDGRATRVETVVSIQATLRDLSNDEVLWSQSGLVFRAQYNVSDTGQGASFDQQGAEGTFFDEETLALDEIARGAASVLVTSILEGF